MDFTIVGGVLTVLLAAIPAVAAYFQRQTRRTRRENRILRSVVQESDLHLFLLERELTARGVRPPPRPALLKAVGGDEPDADPDGEPARAAAADGEAGSGSRHAAPGP